MKPRRWFFLLAALLPLAGGCMTLGPDYERPEFGFETPASYQNAPGVAAGAQEEDSWWKVFNNPEIDRLVEEALERNLDIRKASARILEVRSRLVQSRADRFPDLGIEARARRARQTVDVPLFGPTGLVQTQQRQTLDSHALSLPASFELDLWGRLARTEEAARADLLAAEETRHTVAQTVAAETVTLYLRMESLERRIQVTEESIENFRRSLDLVERRYERGLASILELRQASRILAQAEALLPNLRQELGVVQQQLAVLMGRYPTTRAPRSHQEAYFQRLDPVPPGLPSELLLRRPDVRAAEARLMAANARAGAAEAGRFPRISLTGSFGYSSEELGRLFRPESELWTLALGLVQPLFDGGRLKAEQRAAEARYEQEVAEYAKTVLQAFSEVEGALLTRREQLDRRERVLDFLREARATQDAAQSRYERGLVDYLSVLDAQQSRFQAEETLILVDLAILANRVTLHRALGGGWAKLEEVI